MQLTASEALRDKLELARALMSHRNPSGDLAVIVERAMDPAHREAREEAR